MSDRSHLYRTLNDLKSSAQKVVVPLALRHGAKILAGEIRRQAPVETGKLRDSVKVIDSLDRHGNRSVVVTVGGGHDDEGVDREHIVRFIEYGTANKSPNPFIRRSIDAVKGRVADEVRDEIASGIESASGAGR
jgi:HK97 gp10 family phage protein